MSRASLPDSVSETVTAEKISVGPPYFNLTFGPIILPLLLIVPLGPFLAWKRGDVKLAMQRLWLALTLSVAVGLLVLALNVRGPWLAPVGMAVAAPLGEACLPMAAQKGTNTIVTNTIAHSTASAE